MPTDKILTCRCETTLVGRGRSSDAGSRRPRCASMSTERRRVEPTSTWSPERSRPGQRSGAQTTGAHRMKRQTSTTTLNAKNLKALGATQRCLNPGFSERIGNSRRTGTGRHRWRARAPSAAGRRRQPPDPPIRADQVDRAPLVVSAARRPRTFRFPVAPPRARMDRRPGSGLMPCCCLTSSGEFRHHISALLARQPDILL